MAVKPYYYFDWSAGAKGLGMRRKRVFQAIRDDRILLQIHFGKPM